MLTAPIWQLRDFSFNNNSLESRFQEFLAENNLKLVRLSAILGGMIYTLMLLVDFYVHPEVFRSALVVRLFFVIPISLLGIAATYHHIIKSNFKNLRILLISMFIIGQFGHLLISLQTGVSSNYYTANTILILVWFNTIMSIQLNHKVMISSLCLISCVIYLQFYLHVSLPQFIFQIILISAIILFSLIHARFNEYFIRSNFIKTRKIIEQEKKLENLEFMAAHDLRTPMRVIYGLFHIVEKNEMEHLSPKSKKNIALIKENILNLETIIQNFNDPKRFYHNKKK